MNNKNKKVYIVPKQNNNISNGINAIKNFISSGLTYGYNTFVDTALQYVADNWNSTKQNINDNIITPIANKLQQTKTVMPADWYITDSEDDYVPFATNYYKTHKSPIKEGNVVVSGKDMAQHQLTQGLSMLSGLSFPTSTSSAIMLGAGTALPYAINYANEHNLLGSDLNKQRLYTDLAMALPVGKINRHLPIEGYDRIAKSFDIQKNVIPYSQLNKNYAYRITDINEANDIIKANGIRRMPNNQTVEGGSHKVGRFELGRPKGRSHGGKSFSKGHPWRGSLATGQAPTVIVGVQGDLVPWGVGYHGRYKHNIPWNEIPDGSGLHIKLQQDEKIPNLTTKNIEFYAPRIRRGGGYYKLLLKNK